jgi:hypothetical protein
MVKIEIEESKLTDLLNKLDDANAERKILKSSVIKIMDLLGLIDKETGGLKEDIASGEESFVPSMLKALGDVVSMLTKSSLPSFMGGGDKAKQALTDKFYFIQELLPIINKYSLNDNG